MGRRRLLVARAVFFFHPLFHRVPTHLMITLDAAGLALFAVAGVGKALEYGITPLLAIMMGAVTGAGGGTVRDVLLAQVPGVLHSDVYAAAALAGATGCGGGIEDEDAAWGGDEFWGGGLFCAADGGGVAALESAEGDGALAVSCRTGRLRGVRPLRGEDGPATVTRLGCLEARAFGAERCSGRSDSKLGFDAI